MGQEVSKYPNARCSHPSCNIQCCDSDGHCIRAPHKARSCCVCGRWYCGGTAPAHKISDMVRRTKGPNDHTYVVYKCHACVGTPRKSANVRS
eukprot:scaffold2960_cov179-Chaetoceros_neogracile.AAC.1